MSTFLEEIRVNESGSRHTYEYTFKISSKQQISGRVIEVGDDFVRVQKSSGRGEHTHHIIPARTILYATEFYTSE